MLSTSRFEFQWLDISELYVISAVMQLLVAMVFGP